MTEGKTIIKAIIKFFTRNMKVELTKAHTMLDVADTDCDGYISVAEVIDMIFNKAKIKKGD